jgi:hypothetical protein
MGEQRTFAGIAWSQKGKVTRREQFLAEMDAVIPWSQLLALIEPYYPKAGRGRQPLRLEKMLRIYFLEQWFAPHQPLTARWRAINRARSRTRARGEHRFHVVKRLWGFAKVRYRGLAKNLARAFSLFTLANLYLVRRQLLPPQVRDVR